VEHVVPGEEAAGTAGVVFVFAIVFVFLILAAQYESWSLPFSVLLGRRSRSSAPSSGSGRHGPSCPTSSNSYVANVFAQIGLVMLIGLAAKNAILIVEFAKIELEAGKDAGDARPRPRSCGCGRS
jgi:hydrophobic/amphiphilic exporter-1 (mainly G- bacteria), HAE1 family